MAEQTAAEIFPPGVMIREELDARGWTQLDLAEIMGRPVETVSKIVSGKRTITPETAKGLSDAFGTSAELWLNLESAYQLSLTARQGNEVSQRARIYEIAPVRDMVKRGWVESSSNVDVLEKQIVNFFHLNSINEDPRIEVAARKSDSYLETTPAQLAWFFFAKRYAKAVQVGSYSKPKLNAALKKLMKMEEKALKNLYYARDME